GPWRGWGPPSGSAVSAPWGGDARGLAALDVPGLPALLGASGARAVLRSPAEGPAGGQPRCPERSASSLSATFADLPSLVLSTSARTRLTFARRLWMANSGALSSFGTSLPPPLSA
ncbi:MAG: hypothetical protein M3418_05995, partial [Gemmatimonadota bacterium]|nr:hypothetical protein [Gemmatimonadota bacterium]